MEAKKESIRLDKNLKDLPKEVRLLLFSFFNQKELRIISQVNKEFQEICREKLTILADKYKFNLFYTVGIPIQYTEKIPRPFVNRNLHKKYRQIIPLKEIYASFVGHKIEQVKLFKKEEEACEYSRFLRVGDYFDDNIDSCQPAVFKVIYLGETKSTATKKENLLINGGCLCSGYDLNERTSQVEYFEAKRVDVIPLEGRLKIHTWGKDEFRYYGIIDYSDLYFLHESVAVTPRANANS